jgi:ribonuclease HII
LQQRRAGEFRCVGTFERKARAEGYAAVAGVDEAGRGSLFGPVFAAAVVLSPDRPVRGLRDSKILDAGSRADLAPRIRDRAVAWAVACSDAGEIDRVNIYQASRLAMRRAVLSLQPPCDYLLIDAVTVDLPLPQQSLIHGDARVQAIAAASILAKVARDTCMDAWDAAYPEYGFARHRGYATPEHLEALERYGPTPVHRFSYEPVRACARFLVPDEDHDAQLVLEFAVGGEA